jgi:hypothetical protein
VTDLPPPQEPRPVAKLSRAELYILVSRLQRLAYRDTDGAWNPDKELGADFIGEVCNLLHLFGLSPPPR